MPFRRGRGHQWDIYREQMNIINLFSSFQAFKHLSKTEVVRVSFLKHQTAWAHRQHVGFPNQNPCFIWKIIATYPPPLWIPKRFSCLEIVMHGVFSSFFFVCFATSHKIASSYCVAGVHYLSVNTQMIENFFNVFFSLGSTLKCRYQSWL